jgi:hypothetical protein
VSPDDKELQEGFDKLPSIPVSRRSPEKRKADDDDVITWLRNGMSDSEDPTGEFKKIDQMLPKKKGESPQDRARDIESGLDWCRNKGVLACLQQDRFYSRFSPQSEDRQKDVDNAINWLRNDKSDSDDPTDEFKNID